MTSKSRNNSSDLVCGREDCGGVGAVLHCLGVMVSGGGGGVKVRGAGAVGAGGCGEGGVVEVLVEGFSKPNQWPSIAIIGLGKGGGGGVAWRGVEWSGVDRSGMIGRVLCVYHVHIRKCN